MLCFSEPSWLKDIRHPKQSAEEFAIALKAKINDIREDIKKGNPVTITVKKGSQELPDNYFKRTDKGQINLKEDKEIFVEYSDNLVIVIKSNTLFTACLAELKKQKTWDIHAIVRDPLYTLLSWRSLNIPISRGEIKIGEIYSAEIREIVKETDILKRQILIMNWFFVQFNKNKCNTIAYEQLLQEPTKILKTILKQSIYVEMTLLSSNKLSNYKTENLNTIEKYINKYIENTC